MIKGIGVNLIDHRKSSKGIFEVMKWIVPIGVPVIPPKRVFIRG